MGTLILDAQPVVALVLNEPGAADIEQRLVELAAGDGALISAVNWCEVVYTIRRSAGEHAAALVAGLMNQARISVVDVDQNMAAVAASIKAQHRLSLGDAFAAALALVTNLPLMTGDVDFLSLAQHGLDVVWVGEPRV